MYNKLKYIHYIIRFSAADSTSHEFSNIHILDLTV
jgi:hypothetical protein